jgi:predicted enzyme related to lactoylglutathione lyase
MRMTFSGLRRLILRRSAGTSSVKGVPWLDTDSVIVVRSATQVVEHFRSIAQILDVPDNSVRVIAPYIGGGFGGKEDLTVVPYLKCTESAQQGFQCATIRGPLDYERPRGGGTCVNRYEGRYFVSGVLPPKGTRCAQDGIRSATELHHWLALVTLSDGALSREGPIGLGDPPAECPRPPAVVPAHRSRLSDPATLLRMAVRRIIPYHESPDFEATRVFYTRVLGLEEGNFGGGYIGFGSEQAQVVFAPPGVEPVLPDMGVDVDSREAVDAAHAQALRAGHEVIYGPVDEPWGVRRFFVRDPHGVVISVLAHE